MSPEIYMRRCLQLAGLGLGSVAPNPMVGAVLVHEEGVIGEGWHARFGEAHAEVNAVREALERGHGAMLASSTLYVSLEPCSHFGKTPPCTELIITHRIPKVVVGCRDPFPEVNGRGILRLREAGVEVTEGLLEAECRDLNRRFFVFTRSHRPYVILKWAETADGRIGMPGERTQISGEYSRRLVHKWRSEEAAILVGTRTAIVDDPALTTREWIGKNPLRLVVDMDLELPGSLKLMNGDAPTLVFNARRHDPGPVQGGGVGYYQVTTDVSLVPQILNALHQMSIQSVIVEGGARVLQSFIDEHCWDEARIIRAEEKMLAGGLPAPVLDDAVLVDEQQLASDRVLWFRRKG